MERTIVTPQSTDLHLSIPQKYVGKRVEVIFFDVDEANPNKSPKSDTDTSFQLDEKMKAILDQSSHTPTTFCISEDDLFNGLK